MSLAIEPAWESSHSDDVSANDVEAVLDEISTCSIRISVNNHLMTRLVDHQQRKWDGPRVSAYRLAEWLLWNWWRIRWEPSRSTSAVANGALLSWRQAHETASIGGGWLWPRITFDSDGQTVAVKSAGSQATPTEPISYFGDDTERHITAKQFEEGVDSFVRDVLTYLDDCKIEAHAPMRRLREELDQERSDRDMTMYRRLEALLGCNPDQGSRTVISRLIGTSRDLGEQATNEVAAGVPMAMVARMSGKDLRSEARRVGVQVGAFERHSPMSDRTMTFMESRGGPGTAMIPWRVGANAAKAFRESERLGDGPITDRMLGELCGIPSRSFRGRSSAKQPMAYRLKTRNRAYIVFRARVPSGRRFEAARLLGDKLLVNNDESLQPVTSTHTYRQKIQRSFAAELLCPSDALSPLITGDSSEEAIEEVAARYRVSPMLVTRRLENAPL